MRACSICASSSGISPRSRLVVPRATRRATGSVCACTSRTHPSSSAATSVGRFMRLRHPHDVGEAPHEGVEPLEAAAAMPIACSHLGLPLRRACLLAVRQRRLQQRSRGAHGVVHLVGHLPDELLVGGLLGLPQFLGQLLDQIEPARMAALDERRRLHRARARRSTARRRRASPGAVRPSALGERRRHVGERAGPDRSAAGACSSLLRGRVDGRHAAVVVEDRSRRPATRPATARGSTAAPAGARAPRAGCRPSGCRRCISISTSGWPTSRNRVVNSPSRSICALWRTVTSVDRQAGDDGDAEDERHDEDDLDGDEPEDVLLQQPPGQRPRACAWTTTR